MDERKQPSAINGVWWFPDEPGNRWTGVVSLSNEGRSPTFDYTVPIGHRYNPPLCPAAILGEDRHGKSVSLLRLGRENLSTSNSLAEVSYSAGHVFRGLHVLDTSELSLRSFSVYMQHLYGWLNRTGFQHPKREERDAVNIRHTRSADLTFSISESLSLTFGMRVDSWDADREQSVKENTYFELCSAEGFPFTTAHDFTVSFTQLLHFATLGRVYPISCCGEGFGAGQERRGEFDWYSGWMREPVKTQIDPGWWVFRFEDVQHKFGLFYANWLTFTEQQREALASYFATVYSHLSNSVAHLCLTQALEAYQGTRLADHHRNFEIKIRELAVEHQAQFRDRYSDPADFATTVRHNRNYYTHHNPVWLEKGRVLRGSGLYQLNETLRLLFQAAVLRELQLPAERCSRLRRQLATRIVNYY
jgi:ApeA N-terminal domain 1